MDKNERPPSAVLMQLITGKYVTQIVAAAAQLGIADRLGSRARSAVDVAREGDTDEKATYRLMRAMSAIGLVVEVEPGVFSLTAVGEPLRTDVPGSLAPLAKLLGEGFHHALWAELSHCVTTGESAYAKVHGTTGFAWLNAHPREFEAYSAALACLSVATARAVAAAYDFASATQIVDVGGGHGVLLREILAACPHARGILFDAPPVIEATKRRAADKGETLPFDTMPGDFFKSVPPGCDTYVIKNVLHDWTDEQAIAILRNVARAMPRGARTLVVETVMPPPGVPHFSKVLDLDMLVMTQGGRERTEREYAALLARAGMKMTRVVPTPSAVAIVEGVKEG